MTNTTNTTCLCLSSHHAQTFFFLNVGSGDQIHVFMFARQMLFDRAISSDLLLFLDVFHPPQALFPFITSKPQWLPRSCSCSDWNSPASLLHSQAPGLTSAYPRTPGTPPPSLMLQAQSHPSGPYAALMTPSQALG